MKYSDANANKLWRTYHGYGASDDVYNENKKQKMYRNAESYTHKLQLQNFVNRVPAAKSLYGVPLSMWLHGRVAATKKLALLSSQEKGRRISIGLKKSIKRKRR